VTALTRTNLLVLDASELRALLERDPRLSDRIHAVVRDRLGEELLSPKGDMVVDEIA